MPAETRASQETEGGLGRGDQVSFDFGFLVRSELGPTRVLALSGRVSLCGGRSLVRLVRPDIPWGNVQLSLKN